MAEFIENNPPPEPVDGFANMGKPIPDFRKDNAYRTCRDEFNMDADKSMATVQGMAQSLERDNPYEAMQMGMRCVDLTGVYRLMAVLLVSEDDRA